MSAVGDARKRLAERDAGEVAVRSEAAIKAEALREAADAFDVLPNRQTAHGTVAFYLRDCADRLATDTAAPEGACCCESSPPEFGGNLPDRECPIHGEEATRDA